MMSIKLFGSVCRPHIVQVTFGTDLKELCELVLDGFVASTVIPLTPYM
jgi:hypothetical protein